MFMNKTAAIRKARSCVSLPQRRSSTDYVVYAPYYDSQPNGPSTEMQFDSYGRAAAVRAEKVACIALALMGVDTSEVYFDGWRHGGSVGALVAEGLRQAQ
jgi:hypothetical protein